VTVSKSQKRHPRRRTQVHIGDRRSKENEAFRKRESVQPSPCVKANSERSAKPPSEREGRTSPSVPKLKPALIEDLSLLSPLRRAVVPHQAQAAKDPDGSAARGVEGGIGPAMAGRKTSRKSQSRKETGTMRAARFQIGNGPKPTERGLREENLRCPVKDHGSVQTAKLGLTSAGAKGRCGTVTSEVQG